MSASFVGQRYNNITYLAISTAISTRLLKKMMHIMVISEFLRKFGPSIRNDKTY